MTNHEDDLKLSVTITNYPPDAEEMVLATVALGAGKPTVLLELEANEDETAVEVSITLSDLASTQDEVGEVLLELSEILKSIAYNQDKYFPLDPASDEGRAGL